MTIGEKIKEARISQAITQSMLGGDVVTKNMISLIESNKATPSFDTLMHISRQLKLPIGYLLGEENLFFYKKSEVINDIHSLFKERDYERCENLKQRTSAVFPHLHPGVFISVLQEAPPLLPARTPLSELTQVSMMTFSHSMHCI